MIVTRPDWRAALELCGSLWDLLGGEVEVVVARLGRHAHAALLRLPDHLHGVARRQVHDVAPARYTFRI